MWKSNFKDIEVKQTNYILKTWSEKVTCTIICTCNRWIFDHLFHCNKITFTGGGECKNKPNGVTGQCWFFFSSNRQEIKFKFYVIPTVFVLSDSARIYLHGYTLNMYGKTVFEGHSDVFRTAISHILYYYKESRFFFSSNNHCFSFRLLFDVRRWRFQHSVTHTHTQITMLCTHHTRARV